MPLNKYLPHPTSLPSIRLNLDLHLLLLPSGNKQVDKYPKIYSHFENLTCLQFLGIHNFFLDGEFYWGISNNAAVILAHFLTHDWAGFSFTNQIWLSRFTNLLGEESKHKNRYISLWGQIFWRKIDNERLYAIVIGQIWNGIVKYTQNNTNARCEVTTDNLYCGKSQNQTEVQEKATVTAYYTSQANYLSTRCYYSAEIILL